MEEAAYDYFARIDELGGMVEAIRRNFPQREIADAAFTYQRELDERKRIVVGVNDFTQEDEEPTADPAHRPGAGAQAGRSPRGDRAPAATAPRSRAPSPSSSAPPRPRRT